VKATKKSTGAVVAIKQMDLDNQPKKELIVTEIEVSKLHAHARAISYHWDQLS